MEYLLIVLICAHTTALDSIPESGVATMISVANWNYQRLLTFFLHQLLRFTIVVSSWTWYEVRFITHWVIIGRQVIENETSYTEQISRTVGRHMVVKNSRYLELAPDLVQVGHCIALGKGYKIPLVVSSGGIGKWQLVGNCYIHGIMRGGSY